VVVHPAGSLGPEGWTSRRNEAWSATRMSPPSRRHARRGPCRRCRKGLVRISCPGLQRSENKKPGGLGPTGSCRTQEAEPPDAGEALMKQVGASEARRGRRGCAGRRCGLRGGEVLHGRLLREAAALCAMADVREAGDYQRDGGSAMGALCRRSERRPGSIADVALPVASAAAGNGRRRGKLRHKA